MFETFFNKTNKAESGENKDIKIDYAEVAKNREKIEQRKIEESRKAALEKLSKEIEIQRGVEKAREELEKEFEHKS